MPVCGKCGGRLKANEWSFCAECAKTISLDFSEASTLDQRQGKGNPPPAPQVTPLSSRRRLISGDIVASRYRIIDLLGRGGMGEVFRAEDLRLRQRVALKFLPAGREERVERLLEEVRLAIRVSHPNVCRIHDAGEAEGRPFITMEHCEGEDLATLLKRMGRLPHERAVEVGGEVCAGLGAIHERGILHRDLKPANLFFDGEGRIRVADFGLAAFSDSVTGDDIRSGTPAYMAPEQISGTEVTVRSDVYALGLVLYEIFTGERTFRANDIASLMHKHLQEQPTPPSDLVGNLDQGVEHLILRCLEKDPKDRPASADAVAAALFAQQQVAEGTRLYTVVACLQEQEFEAERLLEEYGGREAFAEGSPIYYFERPWSAVSFALSRRTAYSGLPESAPRLGGHLGELTLSRESGGARGVVRAEGLAATAALSLASLALPGQSLWTRHAFDLARASAPGTSAESRIRWMAHGVFLLRKLDEAVDIFEVGLENISPLTVPDGSPEALTVPAAGMVVGWRPVAGAAIPQRSNWRIERKLGEGGFGEAWLGRQSRTDERRVFKFCYDASKIRGLRKEITLFRLLKEELGERDDIARILDWSFDESPYFIESEYSTGGDLATWAESQGGLENVPLEVRVEVIAQIAEALAAAHSVGILHKDVKPGNVLITTMSGGDVRIQLSDFGLGRITDRGRLVAAGITIEGLTEQTEAGGSSDGGTRLYMAPEVVEGNAATLQADIYALGVMLYQAVVGDFSRALAPGWRRDIDDEILAEDVAIAVDGSPERRLADAGQLSVRLRSFDVRLRRREEEKQSLEAAARRARRRRLGTAAVLVSILIGGLGIGVAWFALGKMRAAQVQEQKAKNMTRVALGAQLFAAGRPTWGNLALLEVRDDRETSILEEYFRQALREAVPMTLPLNGVMINSSVSLSPDGSRFLAGSMNTARVWDARTGEELLVLSDHESRVASASFSPDGRRILTGSYDRTAHVSDARTGEVISILSGHPDVVGIVSFSPDGSRILTGSDKTVRIWEARTGKEILKLSGHTKRVLTTSFSADGTKILTGSWDRTVRVWAARTGEELFVLSGHTEPIGVVSFSPDSSRILTGSWDSTARVWDARTGEKPLVLSGHTSRVVRASFSPDGSRILTGSWDATARVWDVRTGNELFVLSGHTGRVLFASFSPDGSRILTVSEDNTPRVWDTRTGEEILILSGHTSRVLFASFSPDGSRILTGSHETIQVWNERTGEEVVLVLSGHTGQVKSASFSPDGSRILSGSEDNTARVWDARTGEEIFVLNGHADGVYCASFSPDGSRILTVSEDDTARVWDAQTGGEMIVLNGHHQPGCSKAFSPDGGKIVTGYGDSTARVWETRRGKEVFVLSGHTRRVTSASFSPDGAAVLTGSEDNTARLWDVRMGEEIFVLSGHSRSVVSASFSPDSSKVLTGSTDSTARVWDARTGEELFVLSGHRPTHRGVFASFSPNGTRILTGAAGATVERGAPLRDDTARVWDARTGKELLTLSGHSGRVAAKQFSPDGSRILTRSDHTVQVWDAHTGEGLFNLNGDQGLVLFASFSPDGSKILTGQLDKSVRVWPNPDDYSEYLQARIRARTQLCIPADVRVQSFAESRAEAERRNAACEVCIRPFFDRIEGVLIAEWEEYVASWRLFQGCFEEALKL